MLVAKSKKKTVQEAVSTQMHFLPVFVRIFLVRHIFDTVAPYRHSGIKLVSFNRVESLKRSAVSQSNTDFSKINYRKAIRQLWLFFLVL